MPSKQTHTSHRKRKTVGAGCAAPCNKRKCEMPPPVPCPSPNHQHGTRTQRQRRRRRQHDHMKTPHARTLTWPLRVSGLQQLLTRQRTLLARTTAPAALLPPTRLLTTRPSAVRYPFCTLLSPPARTHPPLPPKVMLFSFSHATTGQPLPHARCLQLVQQQAPSISQRICCGVSM